MNKYISYILLVSLILLTLGCQKQYVWNKASIGQTGWESKTYCMTRSCFYHMDYLIGDEIAFRVITRSGEKDKNHILEIHFNDLNLKSIYKKDIDQFSFNPSKPMIILPSGKEIKARGLGCSNIKKVSADYYTKTYSQNEPVPMRWDFSYSADGQYIDKSIKLNEEDCFYLFFDTPPLLEDTMYKLKLNGLFKTEKPYTVPTLNFKRDYFTHYSR